MKTGSALVQELPRRNEHPPAGHPAGGRQNRSTPRPGARGDHYSGSGFPFVSGPNGMTRNPRMNTTDTPSTIMGRP